MRRKPPWSAGHSTRRSVCSTSHMRKIPMTRRHGSSMPSLIWPRRSASQRKPDRLVKRRSNAERSNTIKRDRKSTRLNSSHSQISYAVFCLKKNKVQSSGISRPYSEFLCTTTSELIVATAARLFGSDTSVDTLPQIEIEFPQTYNVIGLQEL